MTEYTDKRNIDVFISLIESNKSYVLHRVLLKAMLKKLNVEWSNVLFSLLCGRDDQFISKSYILEKLEQLSILTVSSNEVAILTNNTFTIYKELYDND